MSYLAYKQSNFAKVGSSNGAVLGTPASVRRFIGDTLGEIYEREQVALLLKEISLTGGVRLSVEWFEVEPTEGNFDFTSLINVCKQLKRFGIDIVISIFHANTSAYPNDSVDKTIGFTNTRQHNVMTDLQDLATSKVWRYWNAIIDNLGPYAHFFTFNNEPEISNNINGLRFANDGTLQVPETTWNSQDFAIYYKKLIARFKLLCTIKARQRGLECYAGGATYTNDNGYVPNGFSHDRGLDKENCDWTNIFHFLDVHDYARSFNSRYYHPEDIFRDHYILNEKITSNLRDNKKLPVTLTEFGYSAGIQRHAYMERVTAGFIVRQHLMNMLHGILYPNSPIILATQYNFHDALPWVYNIHNSGLNPSAQDGRYGAYLLRENYTEGSEPSKLEFQIRECGNLLKGTFKQLEGCVLENLAITDKYGDLLFRSDNIPLSTHPQDNQTELAVSLVATDSVVTGTTQVAHNFELGQTIEVFGATSFQFNQIAMVTSVPSATTFTYSTINGIDGVTNDGTVRTVAGNYRTEQRGFTHFYQPRYGAKTVSINTLTRLANQTIATATTDENHGFTPGVSVLIAGALTSSFNGTFTILSVPAPNQFTYDTGASSGIDITTGGTKTATQQSYVGTQAVRVKAEWLDYDDNPDGFTADVTIADASSPATFASNLALAAGDKAYITLSSNRLLIAPINYGKAQVKLRITDQSDQELSQSWKEQLGIRSAGGTVDEIRVTPPLNLGNFPIYPTGSELWLFRQVQGSYTESSMGCYVSGSFAQGSGPNGAYTKVLRDPIFGSMWHFFLRDTSTNTVYCLTYRKRDWRHAYGDLGYMPFSDGVFKGWYERTTPDLHALASLFYPSKTFDGTKTVRASMWPRLVTMEET